MRMVSLRTKPARLVSLPAATAAARGPFQIHVRLAFCGLPRRNPQSNSGANSTTRSKRGLAALIV